MMKAAVMTALNAPLEIQRLPDPTPGPTDAVIGVEACGICRSDWHTWQGDFECDLPRVMGHEFGGVIEAVGADVRGFKVGDRVTIPFHMACGRCVYCYTGQSNICRKLGTIGVDFNGGFAQFALVPEANVNLVSLPEEVDALSAAAIGCRFMTAYHAIVDQGQVKPGEWVAVFGIGGVGLSAVQIATVLGAQVIAVDINEEKLSLAKKEGAVVTINAAEDNPVKSIKDITRGGADMSIDALGSTTTARPAIKSLRKGRRHVQIGLTTKSETETGDISLPTDIMTVKEIRFIGSLGCPPASYTGMLTLIANGRLDPTRLVTETVALEETSEVLSSMTAFATMGFHIITKW